jgi:RNA ligase
VLCLSDYLDVRLLKRHLMQGNIGVQSHKNGKLDIYNYTAQCSAEQTWDDVTMKCRGLIVESRTDIIIARPRPKFFYLDTPGFPEYKVDNLPFSCPWEVTDKLDGCLGTFYVYDGKQAMASRGSFHSDIAEWANTRLAELGELHFPSDHTPVFELIWKGFPIVLKYPFDDIVLTGLIDNKTGAELPHRDLCTWANHNGLRVVERINGKSLEELRNLADKNKEGYVLSFDIGECPPLKVKIKTEHYRKVARVIKQATPRALWELLKAGDNLNSFTEDWLPAHFTQWVKDFRLKQRLEFTRYMDRVDNLIHLAPTKVRQAIELSIHSGGRDPLTHDERKAIALYLGQPAFQELRPLVFSKMQGVGYRDLIWKKTYPAGTRPLVSEQD